MRYNKILKIDFEDDKENFLKFHKKIKQNFGLSADLDKELLKLKVKGILVSDYIRLGKSFILYLNTKNKFFYEKIVKNIDKITYKNSYIRESEVKNAG